MTPEGRQRILPDSPHVKSRGLRDRELFHRSTSWECVCFPLLPSPEPAHQRSHKHTETEQRAGNDQYEHDVEQGISLLRGPCVVISPRSGRNGKSIGVSVPQKIYFRPRQWPFRLATL